jgi:hypothetical protein
VKVNHEECEAQRHESFAQGQTLRILLLLPNTYHHLHFCPVRHHILILHLSVLLCSTVGIFTSVSKVVADPSGRLVAGIEGSNPARSMEVSLAFVCCVVLCR